MGVMVVLHAFGTRNPFCLQSTESYVVLDSTQIYVSILLSRVLTVCFYRGPDEVIWWPSSPELNRFLGKSNLSIGQRPKDIVYSYSKIIGLIEGMQIFNPLAGLLA